jgi:hypothetical protein
MALVFTRYWETSEAALCALKVNKTAMVPAPVVMGNVMG